MPLPYPDMVFTPFDPLTAEEMMQMVANIEALQDWSAFEAGSFDIDLLSDKAITAAKIADDLAANFQYPTTETLTSATFDGNPVYVKTYTGTFSADARTTVDGSFSDAYKIISANGYRRTTGGSVFMNTIPDNVMSISLDSTNGLTIQHPTTTYSGRAYMLRVFYTKS